MGMPSRSGRSVKGSSRKTNESGSSLLGTSGAITRTLSYLGYSSIGSSSCNGSTVFLRHSSSSITSLMYSLVFIFIIRSGYGGSSGSKGIRRLTGSKGAKCYSSSLGSISKLNGVSGSTGQYKLGMTNGTGSNGGSSGSLIGKGLLVGADSWFGRLASIGS